MHRILTVCLGFLVTTGLALAPGFADVRPSSGEAGAATHTISADSDDSSKKSKKPKSLKKSKKPKSPKKSKKPKGPKKSKKPKLPKNPADDCNDGTDGGGLPGDAGLPVPDGGGFGDASDLDGDGMPDADDNCPIVPNSNQADANFNGVGDVCECTHPAPGRCIAGGGNRRTDCLLEFNTPGPIVRNRKGTRVRPILRCMDGELGCDQDGVADGQCTFAVSICLANSDPRLNRCQPTEIRNVTFRRPRARRAVSSLDLTNALRLEEGIAAMGLEVSRARRVLGQAFTTVGKDSCSAPIMLTVPAPAAGRKRVRRKIVVQAQAVNGRRDRDRLFLDCRAAE